MEIGDVVGFRIGCRLFGFAKILALYKDKRARVKFIGVDKPEVIRLTKNTELRPLKDFDKCDFKEKEE